MLFWKENKINWLLNLSTDKIQYVRLLEVLCIYLLGHISNLIFCYFIPPKLDLLYVNNRSGIILSYECQGWAYKLTCGLKIKTLAKLWVLQEWREAWQLGCAVMGRAGVKCTGRTNNLITYLKWWYSVTPEASASGLAPPTLSPAPKRSEQSIARF